MGIIIASRSSLSADVTKKEKYCSIFDESLSKLVRSGNRIKHNSNNFQNIRDENFKKWRDAIRKRTKESRNYFVQPPTRGQVGAQRSDSRGLRNEVEIALTTRTPHGFWLNKKGKKKGNSNRRNGTENNMGQDNDAVNTNDVIAHMFNFVRVRDKMSPHNGLYSWIVIEARKSMALKSRARQRKSFEVGRKSSIYEFSPSKSKGYEVGKEKRR